MYLLGKFAQHLKAFLPHSTNTIHSYIQMYERYRSWKVHTQKGKTCTVISKSFTCWADAKTGAIE